MKRMMRGILEFLKSKWVNKHSNNNNNKKKENLSLFEGCLLRWDTNLVEYLAKLPLTSNKHTLVFFCGKRDNEK